METYSAVGSVAAAAAAAPNKPLLPLPIPSMLAAIARASNASSSSIIDEDAADGGKDAVGAGVCGVAPAEAGGAKGALDPIPSMLAAIARANSASSSAYPPPPPPLSSADGWPAARGRSCGLLLREDLLFGPPPSALLPFADGVTTAGGGAAEAPAAVPGLPINMSMQAGWKPMRLSKSRRWMERVKVRRRVLKASFF